jgi:capsular polysaccharide biosynthesis protein
MRLRYALPAGLLDAGFASLATLGVGVYAARTLTASELGAYALFFSAFLFAAVVPNQLVLVPAEFATLPVRRIERLGLLRQTARLGVPVAVVAATVASVGATIGAKAPRELLLPLALSTAACAVVSPLQDHIRRLLHLAGVSWRAAGVSVVQLLAVAGSLGLFALAEVPAIWRPFGALAVANMLSLASGYALAHREWRAFRVPRAHIGEAIRSGRWLLLIEVVTTGALFLSAVVITHLASAAALGHAEAARIVAQPIFVLTIGLGAVLGPRSMEAAAARDRLAARRVLVPFSLLLVAISVAYGAVTVTRWPGNLVGALVPQAYAVPGLVPLTVLALMLNGGAVVLRSELLGGGWARVMPRVGVVAAVAQCLAAGAAVSVGALARPLGMALFGVVLLAGYVWQRRAMYASEPAPAEPEQEPAAAASPAGSRRRTRRLRQPPPAPARAGRYTPFWNVGRAILTWYRGVGGSVRVDRLPGDWDEGPGLVASVWRYRWLVAVVTVLGAVAGFGFSTTQPVAYEATSGILLAPPSAGRVFEDPAGQQVEPDRYVRNQAAFMASPLVLRRAVQLVNGRVSVKELRQQLTTEPSQELDLVTVRVHDPTAQGAAELADAVGQAYEETAVRQAQRAVSRTVQQLRATQAKLQGQIDELRRRVQAAPNDQNAPVELKAASDSRAQLAKRIREIELEGAVGSPVALRERADVPEGPVQPKPKLLAAAGGLLAFALAAALAWWLSWRRQPATAGGLPRPQWPHALPSGARRASVRARLLSAVRSRLRRASAPPAVTQLSDARSTSARARLIMTVQSREESNLPPAAVGLAERLGTRHGHRASSNGFRAASGNGPEVDLYDVSEPMPSPHESDSDPAASG